MSRAAFLLGRALLARRARRLSSGRSLGTLWKVEVDASKVQWGESSYRHIFQVKPREHGPYFVVLQARDAKHAVEQFAETRKLNPFYLKATVVDPRDDTAFPKSRGRGWMAAARGGRPDPTNPVPGVLLARVLTAIRSEVFEWDDAHQRTTVSPCAGPLIATLSRVVNVISTWEGQRVPSGVKLLALSTGTDLQVLDGRIRRGAEPQAIALSFEDFDRTRQALAAMGYVA
jgi:hypothetical protein